MKLLSSFANVLLKKYPPTSSDYMELSKEMVYYANGNPLALKVLGSFFHCRRKEEWQSALIELKKVLNKEIHSVLKISYDGLNDNQKEIFFDISCFFKGKDKVRVQRISMVVVYLQK